MKIEEFQEILDEVPYEWFELTPEAMDAIVEEYDERFGAKSNSKEASHA